MRQKWRRFTTLSVCLAFLVLVVFFPGMPWEGRIRHAIKKSTIKAEMKIAKWRGQEPRLLSIAGKLSESGLQVQALDSRSGWASLSGTDGKFVLPGVMWYPGATFDLIISKDEASGRLIKIQGPQTFPDDGVFEIGDVDTEKGQAVRIASLFGVNSVSREDFDVANMGYYKDLFEKLTSGRQTDEEKIDAINDFVSTKLNYEETQWELGSPRRILERGSQYCGHLSTAMETLLAVGGYRVRSIHMSDGKNPPGTHAVVEAFYNGGWHLYDPTFGVRFIKNNTVASYRDVRLDPSLIKEDLFQKFRPKFRRELMELLPGIYETGYHHYYDFKNL